MTEHVTLNDLSDELHRDFVRVAYNISEVSMSFETSLNPDRTAARKAIVSLLHLHQISQDILNILNVIVEGVDFDDEDIEGEGHE